MQVRFQQGIHVPEVDLWLDPPVPRPVAFVSHAHCDHVGRHAVVYCTAATAALMRQRGFRGGRFEILEYRRPHPLPGGGTITLYPAGHILGSAQALVEAGGRRLLYSGDFKLRPGRAAEPAEVPPADVVVMETTFGHPRYRFPATETVAAEIRAFCREALAEEAVAVLYCYSLGKGQELLAWLDDLEGDLWVHPAHAEIAAVYRAHGIRLPECRVHRPGARLERGILLCPPGSRRGRWLEGIRRPRTAYVSGWAADRSARYRFRTDACFPLSDHADYPDLLEYARRAGALSGTPSGTPSGPCRIHTVHGFSREFARDLRARGYHAACLRYPEPQLSLPL